MRTTIRLCVVGALAASVVVALPAGADSHLQPVLTGIDNPRGLTFDAAGNLYVAASGAGGDGACISAPESDAESCYGATGAIHRLLAADVGGSADEADAPENAFVPSLPSHAVQEGDMAGGEAGGPADVSVGDDGRLYFTIGLGGDPAVRDGAFADFATLQSASLVDGSDLVEEADLGDHEADDPDQQGADTNPFGLVVDTDGDVAVVADSGGNTILQVDLGDGTVTTGAVLPPRFVPAPPFLGMPAGSNMPSQAVPTGLAELPDGGYVVGELTGFPFALGSASLHTFDGARELLATGFTNVMDVAVGPDGALYVLELAHDGLLNAEGLPMGALIRVTTDGGAMTRELLVDDLPMPGGVAFGPLDGMAYITTMSGAANIGEVVRFDVTGDPLVTVTDDTATTQEDMRLVAGDAEEDRYTTVVADVTANDGDDIVEVTPLGTAQGAVASGSIVYQPGHHFSGEDAVPYRACTEAGDCLVGVLTVTVEETATDRIAGENRVLTAATASMGAFPDGAPTVVVARADLYPDALAGGPLAQVAGGPILLTAGDALDPATAAEIRRLGPAQVYVLGGAVAIGDSVVEAIRDIVPATERVSGENRYETAVEIMEELDTLREAPATNAFVVEGYDPDPNRGWPDAVSVSGLASWQGEPILLVETDRLPAETAAALDGIDATIIGGSVAIGDATRAAIGAAADDASEIAGATRYATSRLIAEASFELGMRNPLLTLVSGGNWPDALVAGPLVADASPTGFMLVHPTDLAESPETVAFIEEHGPFADVDLFGGRVAISEQVEAGIAAANG